MSSKDLDLKLAGLSLNSAPPPAIDDRRDPSSDEDDNGPDPYEEWMGNLKDFETNPAYVRIFTRKVLADISNIRDRALDPANHTDGQTIRYRDIDRVIRTVWKAPDWEEVIPTEECHEITVLMSTRVEMTKGFQIKMPHTSLGRPKEKRPHKHSYKVELMHRYNSDAPTPYIPLPFVLWNTIKDKCNVHEDNNKMERLRNFVSPTANLWKNSSAAQHVRERFKATISWTVPIRKIVGIGLGPIREDKHLYGGILQYMAVFTIAATLDAANRAVDANHAKIRIILQDPAYQPKDKMLLEWLYRGQVEMMRDPDGILAIDESTLVISAFLPNSVPLMQVIADMFDPGTGPAGIMVDNLNVSKTKILFRCKERGSPAVTRMMQRGNYRDFSHEFRHRLDEHILDHVHGRRTGRRQRYWVEAMTVHLREK
ncbi:hypothetical protein K504DRAFT_460151 [Pleomassaria siparia CBS 279.74]|uniref:SRR1-like domain-containing protein n=1 Tax=Pleomassaria siparia CBS 279.74 TaxID=1314801 RepID=A0A6G1JZN0_9PLEO|nr:hypothetical protein K504DRAFT_460151 [Pleomassaria siparia CBS 279.74]